MKPVIEAKSLSKKYGDLTAVNNIDFTINEGETFGALFYALALGRMRRRLLK